MSKDWDNYTIKIHALKSSAKLIGALELSDKAYNLEMAGKEKNIDYIAENHDSFMLEYKQLGDSLTSVMGVNGEEDKPLADETIIKSVYDRFRTAADTMDCDLIEEVMNELDNYQIPDSDKELIDAIIEKADMFDYDGILEVLDKAD